MRALSLGFFVLLSACTGSGVLTDDPDDDCVVGEPTPQPTPQDFGPETATAEALYHPDHVAEIHIEMAEADVFALAAETNTFFSLLEGEDCMDSPLGGDTFTWFEADITVDGERLERVGVRKKGLIGSLSTEKPGLKVKFDKWTEGQRYGGLERLTLNNSVSDPSLLRQCLGYRLFRDAGIAAPRCSFAHVRVNEWDLGVYVNVEPVKKSFLRWAYAGDDDGDLYEGTVSDFRPGFTGTFQPDTSTTDASLGPILAVTDALEIEGDDAMLDALDAALDIDQFLRFWAMEALIGHTDGYAGNRNNFYVYRPEAAGQLEFLPWGIDWTFVPPRNGSPPVVFAASALPRRLWDVPAQRTAYLEAMEALLDDVWDVAPLLDEVDRTAALTAPYALPDPRRADAQDELRDFIVGRPAAMRSAMAAALPEFDDLLPGSLCLIERGELTAEFSTTWATLGDPAPLEQGTSSIAGTYDGVEFAIDGGAVAGFAENGAALIAALGYVDERFILEPILSLRPERIQEGVPLPLNGRGDPYAALHRYDTWTEAWIELGRLWSGSITLTTFEPWAGGRVEGRVEGPLHSSEGL